MVVTDIKLKRSLLSITPCPPEAVRDNARLTVFADKARDKVHTDNNIES